MDKAEIELILEYGARTAGLGIVQACLAAGSTEPALSLIEVGLPRKLLGPRPTEVTTAEVGQIHLALLSAKRPPPVPVARALLDAWMKQLEPQERKAFFRGRNSSDFGFGMSVLDAIQKSDGSGPDMQYVVEVAAKHGVKCTDFREPDEVARTVLRCKWDKVLLILLEQGFELKQQHVEYIFDLPGSIARLLSILLDHGTDGAMILKELKEGPLRLTGIADDIMPILQAHEARNIIQHMADNTSSLKPL